LHFQSAAVPQNRVWETRGEQRQNRPKKLSTMLESEQEAEWRAEFERDGEEQVRWSLASGFFPEPKRQFAFRWLGDQARDRRARERRTAQVAWWTFLAALGAISVGLLGIAATLVTLLFH
jgi:hypothetical protein